MAFRHRLQARRFELKYIISERCARAARDFLAGYLEPDEHARNRPDYSYPVYSLYLDTPTLALFRQTCCGIKNRFKLRIRFYDGEPTHPAFLEVKQRDAEVICKERASVSREGVRCLLAGGRPRSLHLVRNGDDSSGARALEWFCRLREEVGADATAYVSYRREAYVSPQNDRLRVTFDRNVRGTGFDRACGLQPPQDGAVTSVKGVILEIKFTDCFPDWLRDLVQAFDLQRQSVPKYIHCVNALRLEPAGFLGAQRERVR
jgi:hypothetical protein